VTITSPSSGSTVSRTTTVSANVSIIGALTVAGVQFKLDGANLGAEDATAPYSISWNTNTIENGSHTLTAIARDILGVQWRSDPVTVTVFNDTTPPTVSITSPANGATVRSTVSVTANASDNVGVVGVQFKLDGANLGGEDTTAPYAVSWNTTTATNGSHTLRAVARDAAGNTATSAAVTVTVSNDTTPPTVSITSPVNGATVRSTVTVTANASDNVGVVGVQFRLDGANLGAEDTTVPYAVSWNTTTATNGSHTLTAVARDAAGNRTTSVAVTVTVSNATPPTITGFTPASGPVGTGVTISGTNFTGTTAVNFNGLSASFTVNSATSIQATVPAGATSGPIGVTTPSGTATSASTFTVMTRFEETDPSVTYTAGWTSSTARPWSGGTAAVSTAAGAQATFTFTGTAVNWIGFNGPLGGIARVSLDGVFLTEIDTYAATETISAIDFSQSGLAAASHTLMIEVTGRKNPNATDFFIVVDAFDVAVINDTTTPTVGMTSPASGATVNGTISVTANASDNVGVAGVQFQFDGANLGAEDTTAPYSVSWDTTTASNGSHSLTAIARDAAGNRSTSTAVTVTVSNVRPPTITSFTPASGVVGTSVTTSGTNFTGATAVRFNGVSASFTVNSATTIQATVPGGATSGPISVTTPGGTATSTSNFIVNNPPTITSFTPAMGPVGASVSITGTDFSGATAVQFNGAGATFTVNSPTSIQATVPAAATTGPISVTTPAGTGTSSTPFKPATRFEDTDPAVTTTSGWDRSTMRPWSGGTAAVASTAGEQATFTFTGTDLRWIGFRGPQAGIARVSLDGVFIQQIDFYATAEEVQAGVFQTTGLASGNHTLMIEVTGTKNPDSTGTFVVVDAFDVAPLVAGTVSISSPPSGAAVSGTIMITVNVSGGTVAGVQYRLDGANLGAEVTAAPYSMSWDTTTTGSASHTLTAVARFAAGNTATSSPVGVTVFNSPPGQTRFEDTDPSISFTAGWTRDTTSRAWSGGSAMLSNTAGARATFTFSGTSAYWIGFRGPQAGIARVYVDDVVASDIDAYSSFEQVQATLFQATGLAAGTHTLTIEVTGSKNPASTNAFVVVDAFDDAQQVSPVFIENQQQGSGKLANVAQRLPECGRPQQTNQRLCVDHEREQRRIDHPHSRSVRLLRRRFIGNLLPTMARGTQKPRYQAVPSMVS